MQAVHGADLLEQCLIDVAREQQFVDQPGIVHETLPDQILQESVADDGVFNTGLHGFCQCRPLVLGLAQEFLLEPLGFKKNIEGCQDEKEQTRCEKVAW